MAALGFLIALSLAFISYLIAKSFKLPELAILLLIAALVGPNGLGMVDLKQVEEFSSIGIMFLLYMIGLEFKTSHLVRYGKIGFVFAFIKMPLVALPVALISMALFNLSILEAFILGFGISITSTAIFSQIVKKLGFEKMEQTKQLFAELIWEDIFATFFLLLVNTYSSTGDISISFLTGLIFFMIPYLFVRKIAYYIVNLLPNDKEVYFLFSMALVGFLVFLSSFLNVPAELAAFLAGTIGANFKEIDRIKKNLEFMSSTFIIFFFFSLGMQANISVFLNPLLVLFLFIVLFINLIFKAFSTSLLTTFFGGSTRVSAISGLLMMSIGEFSLLIGYETRELFENFDMFSFISGLVFVSSIISWYFPSLSSIYADVLSKIFKRFSYGIRRIGNFITTKLLYEKRKSGVSLTRVIENEVIILLFLLVVFMRSLTIPGLLGMFLSGLSLFLMFIILVRIALKVSKFNP